jgi:hypothetical protein
VHEWTGQWETCRLCFTEAENPWDHGHMYWMLVVSENLPPPPPTFRAISMFVPMFRASYKTCLPLSGPLMHLCSICTSFFTQGWQVFRPYKHPIHMPMIPRVLRLCKALSSLHGQTVCRSVLVKLKATTRLF